MNNFKVIFHLIHSLGIGGAQTMMFELFNGIKNKYPDIVQRIYLLDPKAIDDKFVKSYGVTYTSIPQNTAIKYFDSAVKDSVFIYHKLQKSDTSFMLELQKKFKTVIVNHTWSDNPKHNRILGGDLVVHVSKAMMKNSFIHVKSKKQIYIHNSINNTQFDAIVPQVKNTNYFTTGRINTFNTIKHSNEWLTWVKGLTLHKPIIHQYLGSGGLYVNAVAHNYMLQKNVKNKNIVQLFGSIKDFNKKISLIKGWDIFLYEINQNEGISMAILEALANGVPVICGNQNSNPEIIKNGINGYIFDSKKQRKDIVDNLVNNPKELENLKKTTKEYFLSNLNISICVDKYIEAINDIKK